MPRMIDVRPFAFAKACEPHRDLELLDVLSGSPCATVSGRAAGRSCANRRVRRRVRDIRDRLGLHPGDPLDLDHLRP
ncbi:MULTISPECIES: hypothetical protein [Azotobacter]|uniref:hypothetical protein n=1 Tax=Azotobacter TaxID=352 RepID=UPI001114D1C9|nr:hypothetical protein [Azotobacter vinelandii]